MKTETKTIRIPVIRESGEVHILVETKEREEITTNYYSDDGMPLDAVALGFHNPFQELQRIIWNGKYKLELVRGPLTTDKPLLIIQEEA
jgi:hypothetical protein